MIINSYFYVDSGGFPPINWELHLKSWGEVGTSAIVEDTNTALSVVGSPVIQQTLEGEKYCTLGANQAIDFSTINSCDPLDGPFMFLLDARINSFVQIDEIAGNALMTRQLGGYGPEWGIFLHSEGIQMYTGFYGSNNEELRVLFPSPIQVGDRTKIILQRNSDGIFSAWRDGVLCTSYKHSPLQGGVSLTTYSGQFSTYGRVDGLGYISSQPLKPLVIGSTTYSTHPGSDIYELGMAKHAPFTYNQDLPNA